MSEDAHEIEAGPTPPPYFTPCTPDIPSYGELELLNQKLADKVSNLCCVASSLESLNRAIAYAHSLGEQFNAILVNPVFYCNLLQALRADGKFALGVYSRSVNDNYAHGYDGFRLVVCGFPIIPADFGLLKPLPAMLPLKTMLPDALGRKS